MQNWAVVVGVNKYWDPEADLDGAVPDALKMRDWLLNKKGGNVPSDNLKLCLSPVDKEIPNGIDYTDATQQGIIDAIESVELEYKGRGNKFFFYYSGHGVNYLSRTLDASAIVPTDVRPGLSGRFNTNTMMSISSIVAYLKGLRFRHQFFFIDACRNIPYDKEFWKGGFVPGGFPGQDTNAKDFNVPARNQFVFYATSPGLSAIEVGRLKPYGIFTGALIEGLSEVPNGAKIYDDGLNKYRLTVSSLFEYVKGEVEKRKEQAGEKWEDVIQVPIWNISANENPELAVFDSKSFSKVNLDVYVKPPEVKGATVYVYTADQIYDKKKATGKGPVPFTLPPRRYGLVTVAPKYRQEPERDAVSVWSNARKTVIMRKMPPGLLAPPPIEHLTDEPVIGRVRSRRRGVQGKHGQIRGRIIGQRATITVQCADHLAPLEIADGAGKSIAIGTGRLTRSLSTGNYSARLIGSDGRPVAAKEVILRAGSAETITLVPPAPFATSKIGKELADRANFDIGGQATRRIPVAENMLGVSESNVGPIANPELSTVLALAGTASTFERSEWYADRLRKIGVQDARLREVAVQRGRLRRIGIQSFAEEWPHAASGLNVMFAFDTKAATSASQYMERLQVRLWRLEGSNPIPARVVPFSIVNGLAGFSKAEVPGSYCLSVKLPDLQPLVFYLALLPKRLTLVIFHRLANGELRVTQYMPQIRNNRAHDEAARTRRLDLLQRFYLSGSLNYAYENSIETINEMLREKWIDPVFGVVGGYLMLRLGKPRELAQASMNMVYYYDTICDSHVLHGQYLESNEWHQDAKQSFIHALEAGIPIFAEGLDMLSRAAKKYNIQHPRVQLLNKVLENRVRGLIWTAEARPSESA